MIIYTVKSGENEADIAAKHNISIRRLSADNGLFPRLSVTEGQNLIISSPVSTYNPSSTDTTESIAKGFSIDKDKLLQSNPELLEGRRLNSGDEIGVDYGEYKFGKIKVMASLKPITDKGLLKKIMPYLTYVSLRSCILRADGSLYMQNDEDVRSIAREYKAAPILEIQRTEYRSECWWNVIENVDNITRTAHNIKRAVLSNGYSGVNLNFGEIPKNKFDNYVELVSTLKAIFDPWNIQIVSSIPESTVISEDIETLCDSADVTALFPKSFKHDIMDVFEIEDIVNLECEVTEPSGLALCVPMSALDSTFSSDGKLLREEKLSTSQAVRLAMERKAIIKYDEASCLSEYEYLDLERGELLRHKVQFQGLDGLYEILCVAKEIGVGVLNIFNADKYYTPFWKMLAILYDIEKI